MFETFKMDVARWVEPSGIADPDTIGLADIIKLTYRYLSLRAMFWFRLGSWFKQHNIPMMPGLIQRMIQRAYGLEILVGSDVGGGLYIAHTVGTVISPRKIGENVSIIAAVTIGMRNEWAFPSIGDNVFIGAGARVLGGITIGDRAQIGANAVVIHPVEAGATVVGIPAKPIHSKKPHLSD